MNARALVAALWVLLSTVITARPSVAQPAQTPQATTVSLRTLPGEQPRYVCVLIPRAPEAGEPRLEPGWMARVREETRAANPNESSVLRWPPRGRRAAPRVDDVACCDGTDERCHASQVCCAERQHQCVAWQAFNALMRVPDVPLASTCRAQTVSRWDDSETLVPLCVENRRYEPGRVADRTLLLYANSARRTFTSEGISLAGDLLTVSYRGRSGLSLHPIVGHYLLGGSLDLTRRAPTLALQPTCVVRELPIPPTTRNDLTTTVTLRAGGMFLQNVEVSSRVIALPTRAEGEATEFGLTMNLSRGDQTVGSLHARWRDPTPPVELPFFVRSVTFSWSNPREFPAIAGCPDASVEATGLGCALVERTSRQQCRYVCSVARDGLALPLRARFSSAVTLDEWGDTLDRFEQDLHAPPDPQSRHLLAQLRAWPEDLRSSDEIDEYNVISERDQVFHLYPPTDGSATTLVSVPGARHGTLLRVRPFGMHAFVQSRSIRVENGTLVVPDPAGLVRAARFGLRVGGQTFGAIDGPVIPWKVGVHAEATLRVIAPRFRFRSRFVPVDVSLHYEIAEQPYVPLRGDASATSSETASAWYNRLGLSVSLPIPWTSWFRFGPTVSWMMGWPLRGQYDRAGVLPYIFGAGATVHFALTRQLGLEFDALLQATPCPVLSAPAEGGAAPGCSRPDASANLPSLRFDGDSTVSVDWRVGAVIRLGVRLWI